MPRTQGNVVNNKDSSNNMPLDDKSEDYEHITQEEIEKHKKTKLAYLILNDEEMRALMLEERRKELSKNKGSTNSGSSASNTAFTSPEQAQEVMGSDFLGPEAIEKTFGFMPKDIPPIPFSIEDLERAKELNQFLILRVDKTSDGKPLTMERINEMLEEQIEDEGKGKILLNDWNKNEDFFTKDTPRLSWALVSKAEIPGSTLKNYLQQTEQIIDYLTNAVFKDVDPDKVPQEYTEAMEEFEAQKAEIAGLITSNWQEEALRLSNLKINKLTRQSPIDAMYDFLMYLQNNNIRLMEFKYTWTYRRDSVGWLVSFGYSDADGAFFNGWTPDSAHGPLGVAFSRLC